MGQWTIVIHGTGAHHNWATTEGPDGRSGYITGRKNDYDADLLFAEFVDQLKARGHTVTGATFTHGGMEGADNVLRKGYRNPHLPSGLCETQEEIAEQDVVEDYIQKLIHAPSALQDPAATLVYGNLRGFYAHLKNTGRLKA